MKNIFSLKLYLAGLQKIKTAGIAAVITIVALNTLVPLVAIIESNLSWFGVVRVKTAVSAGAFSPFHLLMPVFGVIMIYSMFSFMNERNKSDFWHAVPQKRICVYFSLLAAVCTWIFAVIVTSSTVNVILWALAKNYVVRASVFFATVGVYFLNTVLISLFMLVAMTITGTTVSNLLVAALFTFFFRIMGVTFISALNNLTPMLDTAHSFWRILAFDFFMPVALLENLFSSGLGAFSDLYLILYTALVIVLLISCGAFGYCLRKSETATKSAPNKILQHVYRCLITLPIIFFSVTLILMGNDELSAYVILCILALVIWILYEVMTTKKIKNVWKSLPVLIVPIVVSMALGGGVLLSRCLIWSQTPEPHEIKGVSVSEEYRYDDSYEAIVTKDIVFGDEEVKTVISDAIKQTVQHEKSPSSHEYHTYHFVIHQKSGISMGRYLKMDDKEYYALHDKMYASKEYSQAILSLPTEAQIHDVYFSNIGEDKATTDELWELFVSEYQALSDDAKREIKEKEGRHEDMFVGSVFVSGYVGFQQFQSEYPIIYKYMPKTAQKYLEYRDLCDSIFGYGAKDDVAKLGDLAQKAMAYDGLSAGKFGEFSSTVSVYSLYGDMPTVGISAYEDKENRIKISELLQELNTLSDPEDYACEQGKTIVYLNVSVDLTGQFLLDSGYSYIEASEISVDGYYYISRKIPLALTEEEVKAVLAVFDKK